MIFCKNIPTRTVDLYSLLLLGSCNKFLKITDKKADKYGFIGFLFLHCELTKRLDQNHSDCNDKLNSRPG